MLSIFISYRKSDSRVPALILHAKLAERFGEDSVFMDEPGLQPGDHWLATLKRELVRSDVQLVLIGPDWLTAKDKNGQLRLGTLGDIVTLEIAAALECGATVIPVLLAGAQLPGKEELPPDLGQLPLRQRIRIEHVANDEEVNGLINVLADLPVRSPESVGDYFQLGGRIGKTRHTEIYQAVPESDARSFDAVAIHLLRQNGERSIRDWFDIRCSLWRRVLHHNVVKQHVKSDFKLSAKLPFFAVPAHRDHETLDDEIKDGGGLERSRIVDVLNLASSICESAHDQGILLQSLEPVHFWKDASGEFHYGGFDAAVELGETGSKQGKAFREYCVAPERLAPEEGTRKAGYAVDTYALGMLLKAMELETGQQLERLTGSDRRNKWRSFVFHCLWDDPGGRFLHPDQFRHFLAWCSEESDPLPDLVALDAELRVRNDCPECVSRDSVKYIGRTPVTNFEYEQFCLAAKYPLHCPDSNSRRVARRLQGPFCPVVNVSLNDARAYCDWLSMKTGRNFRLPTEVEWMHAAQGCEKGLVGRGYDGSPANCGNRFGGPTVVGAFNNTRSDIGCWDMLGNVWEWCGDQPGQGTGLRILKGGSYSCGKSSLSCTSWQTAIRTCRASNVGFRILRED